PPYPQRIWCAIHDPADERKVRARLGHFAADTRAAGHDWHEMDLTHAFGRWLGGHECRDEFFESPAALGPALDLFRAELVASVRAALDRRGPDDVLALHGVSGLFRLMSVSALFDEVNTAIRGRLLVFFPGTHRDSVYRLLDAQDGWNYHAIPIKADDSETR
ncbi:MAG: hypothetical protein U0326_41800, partial [Polyangiales bacterium]